MQSSRFVSWYCLLIGIALIQFPSLSIAEVLSLDDGSSYEGQVVDGVPHGYGTMSYSKGDEYVGEFQNGNIHGRGTMSYANGEQYVGEWKDNEITGRGTFNYANGEKFVGEFKAGKRDGRGTYTYSDGSTEVGKWQDDQKKEDVTSTALNKELDLEYWKGIKDSKDQKDYEGYIRRFPDGVFVVIAKTRLETLKNGASIGNFGKLKEFSGIYKVATGISFCYLCNVGYGGGYTRLKLEISGDSIQGTWDIHYDSYMNERWAFVVVRSQSIGDNTVKFGLKRIGPWDPYWPDNLDVFIEFLDNQKITMNIKSKKGVGTRQLKEYLLHGEKVKK